MDYRQLQAQIKSGKMENLYLVYGEDTWQVNQALKSLQDIIPPEERVFSIVRIDGSTLTPPQLEAHLQFSLLGERKILLVEDFAMLKNKGRNRSEEEQEQGESSEKDLGSDDLWLNLLTQKDHIIIFYSYNNIDKRRKFVRSLLALAVLVECPQLKGQEMIRVVQDILRSHRLKADFRVVAHLAQIAGSQVGIAEKEVEKLAVNFAPGKPIKLDQALPFLSEEIETDTFKIIELVSSRKFKEAQNLLAKILGKNEEPMALLGAFRYQIRRLHKVGILLQNDYGEAQISKELSLFSYTAKQLMVQSRAWPQDILTQLLLQLTEAEDGLLRGRRDKKRAVELLLAQLITGVQKR